MSKLHLLETTPMTNRQGAAMSRSIAEIMGSWWAEYAAQLKREKKGAARAQSIKWGLETPQLYSAQDVAAVIRALKAAR
jgi:hypothetical protein